MRLNHAEAGVIYDNVAKGTIWPSADMVESDAVAIPEFCSVQLAAAIASEEDDRPAGLFHGFLLVAILTDLLASLWGIDIAGSLLATPLNELVKKSS